MPKLGLGLGLSKVVVSGGGGETPLDFSALTALPVSRRSAVQAAAETAASTIGGETTAQDVINVLAVGRGFASLLPNDGCLLASSGGATTSQGDAVGAIRSWTGVELATQSNSSLRPISAAAGVFADGTKSMSLGNLSTWTAGEGLAAMTPVFSNTGPISGLWLIGTATNTIVFAADGRSFDSFGISVRPIVITVSPLLEKAIYQVRSSGGTQQAWVNGMAGTQISQAQAFSSTATLFSDTGSRSWTSTMYAFALNSATYTSTQRTLIKQFCAAYYGISGVV